MAPDQNVFDAAQELGFTKHRIRSGGHYEFIHPTAGSLFTSATTSDRRAAANFIAQMERACGRRIARPSAGKYRFRPVQRADLRADDSDVERRNDVAAIDREAAEIRDKFADKITQESNRTVAAQCRDLIAAYDELTARAQAVAHILPPIYQQ